MEEPFTNKDELNVEMNKQEKEKKSKYKLLLISLIIFTIIIILSILIAIFIINSSKGNNNNKNKEPGEMICNYRVYNSSNEIQLLSDFFDLNNNQILYIYINGTEVNITRKYKFETEGLYQIKFILKDGFNMDYMFKDIEFLEVVELISNSYNKIISMKSTFENCINLISVSIDGFNAEEIKSTSKLFYNTGIKFLHLNKFKTNKLEDMSSMFAKTNLDLIPIKSRIYLEYLKITLN